MREWRSKNDDLTLIQTFSEKLQEFKRKKSEKWEKIDDKVQMSINPGTPSEDWIIPPDESETLFILNQDSEYKELRGEIDTLLPKIKECAAFLNFKSHHDYDWVNFTNPLIGNAALEDALEINQQLLKKCKNSHYFWKNLLACFD